MSLDVQVVEERRITFGRLATAAEVEQLGKNLVAAGQDGYILDSVKPETSYDQREGQYATGRVLLVLKRKA